MTRSTDKCRYYLYNSIDEWVEITEEEYFWFLGCVPPVSMDGSWFLAGEPYTHLMNNKGVYLACKEVSDKFYCKYMTIEQYNSRDTKKLDYNLLYRYSHTLNLVLDEGEEPFPFE